MFTRIINPSVTCRVEIDLIRQVFDDRQTVKIARVRIAFFIPLILIANRIFNLSVPWLRTILDIILFVYRDEVYNENTDEKNVLEDLDLSCHVACYGEIKFDISLLVGTSARNLERNPGFFLRDVVRYIKTYFKHHPSHAFHKVS